MGRSVGQRYEVMERLGDGTFFHVARARDVTSGRTVAIKVPQPLVSDDRAFCDALRKSLPDTVALSHGNVARVYEVCEVDGKPVLVTEFVKGMNLKERIKRIAPFTLSVAVDFAIAIGEALQSAHTQGVLHGDVRPHNVMVSPDGLVKVTDFGLGAVVGASPTVAEAHAGRAADYLAPEVAAGGARTIGADIYGLGVILFEMLTGALPRAGTWATSSPISPRALNSGVPIALDGVVMKALQPRVQDRYVQVADILNDLRTIRDALRFGRSLSWTPLERAPAPLTVASSAPKPAEPEQRPAARAASAGSGRAATRPAPESGATAPVGATTVPRYSEPDDRVSPVLKIAIGMVVGLCLIAAIVIAAVWISTTATPPARTLGNLVGLTLDQARSNADKVNVRLIPHEEFSDTVPRSRIIRTDSSGNRPVLAGATINVWVSRGGRMVWVPDLGRLSSDEATSKLKEAGLALGAVNRVPSSDVLPDCVVSQNPRAGKRIPYDQPINLVMSSGPDLSGGPEASADQSTGAGTVTDAAAPNAGDGASPDSEPRTYRIRIAIPRDGRGSRRVRVEYEDANGSQSPVDEDYGEGDVIRRTVEVYGGQITVRVFYGDDPQPVSERTERLSRRSR